VTVGYAGSVTTSLLYTALCARQYAFDTPLCNIKRCRAPPASVCAYILAKLGLGFHARLPIDDVATSG
jgi:hypothetical protein